MAWGVDDVGDSDIGGNVVPVVKVVYMSLLHRLPLLWRAAHAEKTDGQIRRVNL